MIGAISSHNLPIYPQSTSSQTAQVSETQDPHNRLAAEQAANQTAATNHSKQSEQQGENEQQAQQEQQQLDQLKQRDREVRAHEAAHQGAAGALGGAAHYELKTGPDGKRYAVGGEVSIDISKVTGDPQATLAKANRIKSAALAPVDPSSQDRAVAAQATALAAQALKDINAERTQENDSSSDASNTVRENEATPPSQRETAKSSDSNASAGDHDSDSDSRQQSPNRNAVSAYQSIQAAPENAALHLIA